MAAISRATLGFSAMQSFMFILVFFEMFLEVNTQ
jgi:hypothetical protein